MRKIEFRGKRVDNGEWIEGCLIDNVFVFNNDSPVCHIIPNDLEDYYHYDNFEHIGEVLDEFEVIPSTIGQYIGLTDKNGVKIFEGDIIQIIKTDEIGIIKYEDGCFYVGCDTFCCNFYDNYDGCQVEVIGNIYDNPELRRINKNGYKTRIQDL